MLQKNVFLILIMLLLKVICFAQVESKPKVSFRGQVVSINIEKEKKSSLIKIKAHLELLNEGDSDLIILAEPIIFPGRSLVLIDEENKREQILLNAYGGKSCDNDFGELTNEWKPLHQDLVKSEIPDEKYLLKRGQKREFEEVLVFYVPNLISDKPSYGKTKSFEEIKNYSTLWLRVRADLYPFWGLEANCPNAQNLFGEKLKKKWNKFGHLVLNEIVSEPIPLNWSSAIIKTNSKL